MSAPDLARRPTPLCLRDTAARLPDAPAYFVRGDDGWVGSSWSAMLAQVERAARALIHLGVQPGQAVCILGFNRPEWMLMDHAAMMAGAVTAGIYWTSAAPEVEYVLQHSATPLLLLEDAGQLAKLDGRRAALPALRQVVAMRGPALEGALSWEDFLALGDDMGLQPELERRLAALTLEDLGALIYTSGTTGHPKAVMLSHGNLAWAAQALNAAGGSTERDRGISYLPMAHVAEKVGSIHAPVRVGSPLYFARSMELLLEDLKEVRPTIFLGVPRLWEKMQAGLSAKLSTATGFKAALVHWAMGAARRWHELDLAGQRPGRLLTAQLRLARRLVFAKVHAALGLAEARLIISSAAPISPENLRFFLGLDLVVREIYGQSEVCGPTTLSLPGSTRIGAVGRAVPGLELRIAEDGEVLVKSPGVFQGYAGDPEATAATLADGWLHSGDLGRLDADGYLYITGRKKDILITSGGKNISPANLESDLMAQPLIEHAVVVGDGRHFLAALLTLRPEAAAEFAAAQGLAREGLERHPALLAALQAQVDVVNERHARVGTVRKFAVIEGSFSVDAGQLTATMKLRRKVVIEAHRELVESLYTGH